MAHFHDYKGFKLLTHTTDRWREVVSNNFVYVADRMELTEERITRNEQQINQIQLIPGPQGERGIEGPRGLKGERGIQGDKGIQGPIGLKGDRGESGKDAEESKEEHHHQEPKKIWLDDCTTHRYITKTNSLLMDTTIFKCHNHMTITQRNKRIGKR